MQEKQQKSFIFLLISISTQYFKGHILPKDYQSGNRCFGVSGSCLHETDGVKTDIFRRQPWQNVHNFPDHIRGNWAQSKVFFAFAQGRMPTISKSILPRFYTLRLGLSFCSKSKISGLFSGDDPVLVLFLLPLRSERLFQNRTFRLYGQFEPVARVPQKCGA